MAEQVELQIEDMIPELEMMDKLGIFNKNEKRNVIKKRKLHEYKLQRVTKSKDDILRYIKFEVELMLVIKQKMQDKGLLQKKNNLVYSITNRINRLYNIAIRRFPSDCKIWLSYLKYCKQVKLYTCVSRLLDQMLELHGDKPALFKIAASWEFNECHSIERARKFIHQGLHIHKDSKLLFTEGFKLELAYANQKLSQAKEKGDKNDSSADPVIEGNLADVIYTSAIKKISDVTFLVDLLNIAQGYSFTSSLQEKIIEGMKSKYPNEEVTWDTLARRELDLGLTLQDRIRKCISVYEDGLRNVPTRKMWLFYLDYVLEINEDLTTLPEFKKECLKNAFEAANRENMLSEKHYFLWIKKVEDVDACTVLKWGTERIGSSSKLWSWRLRYHLSKCDEEGAMAVFKEVISNPNIPDQANLWMLVLKCYQIIDTAKAENLWNEGVNNPIVGAVLKGRYIEWLAMTRGIMAARKVYATLSTTPPFSLELHEAMSKLEDAQPKVNVKYARQVYETAVNQYGKSNTDVWMWYVKFESKFGKPDLVPRIYEQALKTLNNDLVDVFISEFHLHKAETMNNDRPSSNNETSNGA
ncbi:U3 small nucleolar RNA-associated protein 6 homolog [Halyomorpha halys]|uniref:U3 small nucleolar RNA-associated protein 6 homolog n=1 Tax=Halyomorpha halys TaxID=286706 RepID=UPI0006D51B59